MKKFLLYINVIVVLLVSATIPVRATGYESEDDFSDEYISTILDELDSDTKEIISSFGLEDISADGLLDLSFSNLLSGIKNVFYISISEQVSSFLKMLGMLTVLILLNSFKNNKQLFSGQITDVFSMICIIMLASSISDSIEGLVTAFDMTGKLLYTYTPILAVLLSVSGNVTSSVLYNSSLVALSQVISSVSENIIIPFVSVYFALIIALSFNETVNPDKIISSLNKAVITVLSVMTTLFSMLISGKNILAMELDGIFYKSGKYLVSNLIPVIGPTVSSIFSSVIGSISLVKSTVAIVAILCAAAVNLPVIAKLTADYISLRLISLTADSFGEKKISGIFGSFSSGIKTLAVLVVFELVIVIIATGLVLTVKGGI